MSLYELSDFERTGNTEQDIHFTDLNETREAVNQITQQALKTIQIFTPDLEAAIYDNEEFSKNLLAMVRGNRYAQIQILAFETTSANSRGHALLRLAHELTSTIEIKIPAEEYQETSIAFMLVDKKGFVFRPDTKEYDGIYNPDCKYRSQKLSEIFTAAWEHAEPDPQSRRLNI
ncbi:MAG: hypothetical protein OQK72_01395 [Gammaproteobacteria bacterium]|nr:hypothetical protein [Gammaproteobacteria bacterium]